MESEAPVRRGRSGSPSVSTYRAPLHRVLFRLAARAPHLTLDELMSRLATSLANHYAAVACSFHTDASGWAAASAEPIRAMQKLPRLDRARMETIEARIVREAVAYKKMVSALDLEGPTQIEEFLKRTLGVIDIFAFPVGTNGIITAVLVIFLSLDSAPLADADLHGLMALGELLALAGDETETPWHSDA